MFRSKVHPELKPDLFRQEVLIKYLDDINFILAHSDTIPPNLMNDKRIALEELLAVCERLYILRERLLHEVTLWDRVRAFFGR